MRQSIAPRRMLEASRCGESLSVSDSDNLVDGVTLLEDSKHEVRNVGARNRDSSREIPSIRSTVTACESLIGQAWWSDDGPVKTALSHDVLHHGQICVVSFEDSFCQWTEQIAHEEAVA